MASPVSRSPVSGKSTGGRFDWRRAAAAGQPLASHRLICVAPWSGGADDFAILPIIQAKCQCRPDGTVLALSLPIALGIERDGRERRTTGRSSPQEAATQEVA